MTGSANHASQDRFLASKELVSLLSDYTALIDRQIDDIRGLMSQTVSTVMKEIEQINAASEKQRKAADLTIEKTFLQPDPETAAAISSADQTVERLVSEARGESPKSPNTTPSNDDHLRTMLGKFTAHLENISKVDSSVQDVLFAMMGALSADDVISQRLQHVTASIQALKVGLSYVLIDFEGRFSTKEVSRLRKDLLRVTYSHYSTNEERRIFEQLFGKIDPSGN